jgi:hypothetical protein
MLEAPPQVRRTDAPRALGELLARTMSKTPDERPVSAARFGQELQRIQGGLGLPVTALPLASPPPPPPAPPASGEQGEGRGGPVAGVPPPPPPSGAAGEIEPVPPPPPVEIRAVGDEADGDADGHTVTVGRAVEPPAEHETRTVSSEVSTRRVVIGTVAGVVCLLAVAASLLVFGRDGGDGGSGTTVVGPTTTQFVGLPPPTPQGVSVRRNPEGESVVVAWQAVAEPGAGFTYQVRQENPSGRAVNTAELSVTIDGVRAEQRPCYVVIAISPGGQTSNESELACVQD